MTKYDSVIEPFQFHYIFLENTFERYLPLPKIITSLIKLND